MQRHPLLDLLQVALDEFVELGRTRPESPLITASVDVTHEGKRHILVPTPDKDWLTPAFANIIDAGFDQPVVSFAFHRLWPNMLPDDSAPHTVYVFTEEIEQELARPLTIKASVAYARPPTSRLPPLRLRQLLGVIELLCADSVVSARTDLRALDRGFLAFRARALPDALESVAALCRAQGVVLWSFDFEAQEYRSIARHGPIDSSYVLRLDGVTSPEGDAIGIVSQVRPGRRPVRFSMSDVDARYPLMARWLPEDAAVFTDNGWDACVAWPVVTDGKLLGAFSVYAPSLDDLTVPSTVRIRCAAIVAEYLQEQALTAEFSRSVTAYEDEISRNRFGRLATELVHDYKRSLENARNLLKNLDQTSFSEGLRRMYIETMESVDYLTAVTSTMARLSRGVSLGTTADLADVLESNAVFLQALARRENERVRVVLKYPRHLAKNETCTVKLDELTALRVVINLVHNAALWTRGVRSPEVSVRLTPALIDRSVRPAIVTPVRLRVEDNGPGVSSEIAPRLFRRGESNRKAEGGSGLGLYIVRNAVEAAGGTVVERGRPGEGAVFDVILPAVTSGSRGT